MDYKDETARVFPPEKPGGCMNGCRKECSVYANVDVPVEVEPRAEVGKIEAECCGDPAVTCECTHDGGVRLTLTQSLLIKIPVCYNVRVKAGKGRTECHCEK